jgi:3-dehydroquinate synthase
VIDRRAQLAFVFPEPAVARTRVRVASGLRFDLAGLLIEEFGHAPAAVLIDSELERLWAKDIEKGLSSAVVRVSLPRGEACKNADEWALRAQELVRLGIKRSDYIVAIGGGATCDLAGAVAASVLRGIPVVHVPTTLLAMVDAGLGGKCGVNLPEGKNLLGFFHHPRQLLVDPEFLSTLPEQELQAGLGEVCKYAIGFDRNLCKTLEQATSSAAHAPHHAYSNAAPEWWQQTILACLAIKGQVVSEDPRESEGGQRILLNLGHTTAHALETLAQRRGKELPHGLAVGLGLRVALRLAEARNELPSAETQRFETLLDHYGQLRNLDWKRDSIPEDELRMLVTRDKKRRDARLRVVLPRPGHLATSVELEVDELLPYVAALFTG